MRFALESAAPASEKEKEDALAVCEKDEIDVGDEEVALNAGEADLPDLDMKELELDWLKSKEEWLVETRLGEAGGGMSLALLA